MKNRLIIYMAVGLCLVFSGPVFSQDAELPLYSVEYIIVRALNPVSGTEIWPLDETIDDEKPAQRFAPMPESSMVLGEMARRLSDAKDLRVIHHDGWIQPGYASEDAHRKIIKRSIATGESVSGHFLMERERYLRLEIDLTFVIEGEIYRMRTGRRMLSRRTHYFDHPYGGVIARITPVEIPVEPAEKPAPETSLEAAAEAPEDSQ